MSYINININHDTIENKDDFKQRNLRNFFICDLSQLPKEKSLENILNSNSQKFLIKSKSQNQFQSNNNNNINLPNVILISSQSDILLTEANENDKLINYSNENNTTLNLPYDFERPLSRRGSRESTPEEGTEECENSREETPLPLGDELDNNNKIINDNVLTNFINFSYIKNDLLTDKNEKKDDELRNYYILQNYSSNNEHLNNLLIKTTNNVKTKSFLNSNSDFDLTSDSEKDEETKMLDRHQYERLQESPLPPPILNKF